MKRIFAFVLTLALLFAFSACSSDKKSDVQEGNEAAAQETKISEDVKKSVSGTAEQTAKVPELADYGYDGTIFTYDGVDYDMSEIAPPTNAVMKAVPAGKNIVVEGHINPNMSAYAVFDSDTREFGDIIYGTNFIWYDDDVSTGVYASWNEVCLYDGTLIASLELGEGEVIYDLAFSDDRASVNITILNDTNERTETVALAAAQ
ncbi:MAG: hypothetical protein IJG50_00950 [Clostridia bacterium]|nr:hypothetical protein [Clostridia bacterium]